MRKWTPWTIALTAACIAVATTLWRYYDLPQRQYGRMLADVTADTMFLLAGDPLAAQVDTQRMVRMAAAAADTGVYVTPESRYALAIQLQREGDNQEAEEVLRQIVIERPAWSWPYALLGSIIGRGDPERLDEAAEALLDAISLEPEWSRPYNSLGVVLRLMGRYEEAEEYAIHAIELAPDDIAAHNNYANLLLVLGRHEEAETHYAYAVALEPDNPKPLYNLACLYSVMGRDQEALHLLEDAIGLSDSMRRDAAVDPYLARLRDLPEFQRLLEAAPEMPEETAPEDALGETDGAAAPPTQTDGV